MPNLAGLYFKESHDAVVMAAVVDRLVRVLEMPGVAYAVREWRDDRFGAVNLLSGTGKYLEQPVHRKDKVLFLDGEVVNLSEVCDSSDTELADLTPALACLQLYESYQDEFVKRLNGQFNILVYEPSRRTVKVFNDRFGYRPFHYMCEGGVVWFGLEKKAIFAARQEAPPLDPVGILEFFTFGHNLGDRTQFDGVRVMAPGAVLEFRDGKAETRQYWRPSYTSATSRVSLDEGADELGRRLGRSVARRTRTDRGYGIFLSGGLDSRAVAGALAGTGRDIASFTFGRDDSADLVFGRQLAEKLGFRFHRLYERPSSFADLLPRAVWRTEGAIPFNEAGSITEHRIIRPKAAVLFNGHLGDVLSGASFRPGQFVSVSPRQLARHIFKVRTMLDFPVLNALFKPSLIGSIYPEMMKEVETSIAALDERRAPLANNLWMLTVRARRFTFSSPVVDRYVVEFVSPFTDNDVVDWMLSMPMRFLFGQRMYKSMIRRTFPDIASVPWARTGRPLSRSFAGDFVGVGYAVARKRMRRVLGSDKHMGVDHRAANLRTYVDSQRTLDAFSQDIFDREGVRRVMEDALGGRRSIQPLLLLVTFAECARLFAAGPVTVAPPETHCAL